RSNSSIFSRQSAISIMFPVSMEFQSPVTVTKYLVAYRGGLATFKRTDQFCHSLRGPSRVLLNGLDNRAAHHGGIRKFPDFGKLLRIGDAKAHGYRQFRKLANALYQRARVRCQLMLCPGHPGA